MYTFSARQILSIAMLAALFAAAATGIASYSIRPFPAAQAAPGKADTGETERRRPGVSDPSTVTDEQNNIEVYRAAAPGVVYITTASTGKGFFDEDDERSGAGSGVVIDDQGHILTNEHVVASGQRLTVTLGTGKSYQARIVGADPDTDLAVVKIDAPREQLTVIPMCDSDKLVVGQKVLAIGNPFGLDRTLTTGVISGLQRPIRARNGRLIEGAIQTDASINPGNSGGPLLDSQGRMIGLNSQILSPAGGSVGVGFAIASNIAKRIVPQLISNGRVTRPRLGVGVIAAGDLRGQMRLPATEGLIVTHVAPGSPAEAAGIRGLSRGPYGDVELGDIIVAADGEQVKNQDDLTRTLDRRQIGDQIEITVVRRNGRENLTVRLTAPAQQPVIRRRM